jgi:radical SAM superfamily enzyme YgiQ (UPF0313 family)
MRVLLISANTERISMVTIPLGLALVAAATRKAGHAVAFLDLLGTDDLPMAVRAAIEQARPEAIGVSIRNIDDQNCQNPRFLLEQARAVVAACKDHAAIPVILGGAGFSIYPRAALDYLGADYGIRGDGEAAFPALLERLQAGQDPRGIEGVQVAGDPEPAERATAPELDTLPLWDEALDRYAWAGGEDFWMPVQSRRGCPNDCSYCSTARVQGRAFRLRSPRAVAEAVAAMAGRGFRRFYFVDNSFNLPEDHALELCRELGERNLGIAWRCILYPRELSGRLVQAMAGSGCVEASLGFESGAPAVLKEMNKHFTPEQVRRTVDLLAAHGIRRMGFLLLGGPGETRDTVKQSLAFARGLNLDGLKVTVGIRIYPGTPLAERAVSEGVIDAGDELLYPRFYLAPGLEPWIREVTAGVGF